MPSSPNRSPERNRPPEQPASSQEVKPSSSLIVARDLTSSPSQSEVQQNVRTMNELAQLSMSPEGRKTIDALAGNRQLPTSKAKLDINTYFRNTFVSIMEQKGISHFSPDKPLPFDRNTPIDTVSSISSKHRSRKVAIGFIVAVGMTTDKKSELVVYREDISKIFKEYRKGAICIGGSEFNVWARSSEWKFAGRIDPTENGGIIIMNAERTKDSKALFLGEVLGEMWLHVLSKIQSGKDDTGKQINIDVSQLSKYPKKLSRKSIDNPETQTKMRLLLKGKVREPGTIEIAKDSQGVWSLIKTSYDKESLFTQEEAQDIAWGTLGTPNGYATAFLPKEYQHIFGDVEHTRIELKIKRNSSGTIDIDEMNFYFDEK
jgi:hypothetical protein